MMERPLIIGITGSIACGKSEFVKLLKTSGFHVYSTDKIGHDVLFIDEVKEQLVDKFGNLILSPDNSIDRKKLSEIVFQDKTKLEYLNSVTHPHIFNLMNNLVHKSHSKYIFFEVPLLFEAKLEKSFDFIITISAKPESQLIRLMKRDNLSKEEAINKISSQLASPIKEEKADYVISNNSVLEDLKLQLSSLLEILPTIKSKTIKQF